MSKEKMNLTKSDFDYEEDVYDRLKNFNKNSNKYQGFTNKATMKKTEFDYEEDAYEPERSK
ncbi:MAG: hypothetical protein A2Y23_03445 [Clostridiales bacterium GWB2_37_7]|nr:MAG: hypothetical protein A2Y23_03445 [Clostridiales bacterium GWB2_37_7]